MRSVGRDRDSSSADADAEQLRDAAVVRALQTARRELRPGDSVFVAGVYSSLTADIVSCDGVKARLRTAKGNSDRLLRRRLNLEALIPSSTVDCSPPAVGSYVVVSTKFFAGLIGRVVYLDPDSGRYLVKIVTGWPVRLRAKVRLGPTHLLHLGIVWPSE